MVDSTIPQTILVTGGTGTVGAHVLAHLTGNGAEIRALTRSPANADLPEGVKAVAGELTDPDAVSAALDGVDGLFLLSPVAVEELTGTLLTLDLARQHDVSAIVYLSVIHADRFTDPPHFAAKGAAERMIADYGLPATVLRPGYYLQNDLAERDRLCDDGIYAPPLGQTGVLAVDVRDLGEVAARALVRRLGRPSAPDTIDVVAPQVLTGASIAAIWAELLDRDVAYGGDLDHTEEQLRAAMPAWFSRDMRLMFARFANDGMVAAPGTDEALIDLLGRPMRSYREFAAETAASWLRR